METLRKQKTGAGHFRISIEIDDEILSAITTNTLAIDAAFDDCYDDCDNSKRYFESRLEAQTELVNEILRKNDR
jgi:phage-related protein